MGVQCSVSECAWKVLLTALATIDTWSCFRVSAAARPGHYRSVINSLPPNSVHEMARTKQTARKQTSAAALLYSTRKIKHTKKNLMDDPKAKLAVKSMATSKPKKSDPDSTRETSQAPFIPTNYLVNGNNSSSITLAGSPLGRHVNRRSTSSVTSLSNLMLKLEVSSAGSGKSRSSFASTNFFSNSTRVLGMVKDVCEAFSGVPYVKSVAGLVQHIIEIADQVEAYKDQCDMIVNKVVLFSQGVFEGLLSLAGATIIGDQLRSLESDLLAFLQVLEGIYTSLESLTAQRVSSRFLRYIARAELLASLTEQEKRLETYIQYFNTRSNIAIRLGLGTSLAQAVSQPRRVTKRLIPVPQNLYGRDAEFSTLVDLFTKPEGQTHLAVLGPGGMGKTAIASTLLTEERVMNKFKANRLFIPCDTTPSLDLFLHELAAALDVIVDGLSSQLLSSILLQLRQQPYLLVFDNFETLWDPLRTRSEVESFLSQISCIPTANLLVTIRGSQHPGGVEWSQLLPPLKPLELQAAKALFYKISRKPEDPYIIDLIKAVDCIPLAVTLLAHLAAVHDVTPEALWERWIEEKTTMIERGEDRLANLNTSIQLSLNSPRMKYDSNALPFLSIIALLPSGLSHDTFRACDIHLPESINVKRATNTLRQNGLIYDDLDRTLRILSPIRHYVLSHHPPWEDANAFIEDYFLQLALLGGQNVITVHERLRREIGNIEEILVRAVKSKRSIGDIVAAILSLSEYTYISGVGSGVPLEHLLERLEKLTRTKPKRQKPMEKVFRRIFLGRATKGANNGDDGAEGDLITLQADCLGCRGQLLSRRGHYDQAKENFESALQLHLQQGDLAGQAADFHNLGCLQTSDEASKNFHEALQLHERIGDRAGVAYDMMGLGLVHLQRCQLPRAKEIFLSALRLFNELNGEDWDSIGCITALNNIGHTFTAWNKFAEAETYFNEAIQSNLSVGDVTCKADSLCGLASTFLLRSRWKEAEETIREAMILRKPFEDPDHYHVLGRIKCAQWKIREAIEALEYARTLPRSPKDELGKADDLKYLAYAFFLFGRIDEAKALFEDVRVLYKSAENTIGLAELGIVQAEVWIIQRKLDKAEAVLKEAVDVMEGLDCKLGKAHALAVYSGVKLANKMHEQAMESIQLALGLHEEVQSSQGQADDLIRLADILISESEPLEHGDGSMMVVKSGAADASKLTEASRIINKAMELYGQIQDTVGLGDGWYLHASLGVKQADMKEAEIAARKALEMHGTAEIPLKQAKDYLLLGHILKYQERRSESIQVADLAVGIFEKMGMNEERRMCLQLKQELWQD